MDSTSIKEYIAAQPQSDYIEVREHNEDTLWIVGEFGGEDPSKAKLTPKMDKLRDSIQDKYPSLSITPIKTRDLTLWFGIKE